MFLDGAKDKVEDYQYYLIEAEEVIQSFFHKIGSLGGKIKI